MTTKTITEAQLHKVLRNRYGGSRKNEAAAIFAALPEQPALDVEPVRLLQELVIVYPYTRIGGTPDQGNYGCWYCGSAIPDHLGGCQWDAAHAFLVELARLTSPTAEGNHD